MSCSKKNACAKRAEAKAKIAKLARENALIKQRVSNNRAQLQHRYGSIFAHPVALGFCVGLASGPLKFLTFRRLRTYLFGVMLQEFRRKPTTRSEFPESG
ncbi:hypothetical protein TDB9533_02531 [Thalassocella blandensis]|nr:hypothetical protein TDB9533_02531 [Thalassocella blandensis]